MLDELAALDATAQADLVRRGEIQAIELVEAAIQRIERLNPRVNAVISRLYDRARDAATSSTLPAGPFAGVPLLLKDYYCYTDGDPYYEGTRFLRDLDWARTRRQPPGAQVPRGGFRHSRQDEPARAGKWAGD